MRFLFILLYSILNITFFINADVWSPPHNLTGESRNAAFPQLVVDHSGNITAIWQEFNEKNLVIRSATKNIRGKWRSIPGSISNQNQNASNPRLVVDYKGNVTAVWESYDGKNITIQASIKPFGGHWQLKPTNLSLSDQEATSPVISVNSKGEVAVVWESFNGNTTEVQGVRRSIQGKWSSILVDLSESESDCSSTSPQITANPKGDFILVWEQLSGGYRTIYVGTLFKNKNLISDRIRLSRADSNAFSPQVVVDHLGNITAVWHELQGESELIVASTKLFDSDWQCYPDRLSSSGSSSYSPQIIIDRFGTVTVVWENRENGKWCPTVQASTKVLRGQWQRDPDTLSPPSLWVCEPRLAVGPTGEVIAIMQHLSREFGYLIQICKKKVEGKWEIMPYHKCISELNPSGQNAFSPQIVVDCLGNATAIWYQFHGDNSIIQTSSTK